MKKLRCHLLKHHKITQQNTPTQSPRRKIKVKPHKSKNTHRWLTTNWRKMRPVFSHKKSRLFYRQKRSFPSIKNGLIMMYLNHQKILRKFFFNRLQ